LAPNDYCLFIKIKSTLKGRRFEDRHPEKRDDITESYSTTGVAKYFQQRQHRRSKCIAAEGEYLEGDPSQLA
jgi:hypothetical protein